MKRCRVYCNSENRSMPTSGFRNTVEKIMNNPESYTKEELHDLFLEMTERSHVEQIEENTANS